MASLLLGNSEGGGGGNTSSNLLSSLLMGKNKKGGGLGQSMAKSFVASLVSKLDDESTHKLVSNKMQQVTKGQLQQLIGAAAGGNAVPMKEEHYDVLLDKVVNLCHSVTPRKINWTVKSGKAVVWGAKLGRKLGRILKKYRSLLVLVGLFHWSKASVMRPIPIAPKILRQQRRAAKLELKRALKASRQTGNRQR